MCELKANLNSAVYHAQVLGDNMGLYEGPKKADCALRKGVYIYGMSLVWVYMQLHNEMCTTGFSLNTGHPVLSIRNMNLHLTLFVANAWN